MIVREIDWRAPMDAFAPLEASPYATLLHAGERAAGRGWSILVAFPETVITAREGRAFADGKALGADPWTALAALAAGRRGAANAAGAPFASGLVGFLGYELGGLLESAGKGPAAPFALPDMAIGDYAASALFDRERERAFILARGEGAARRLEEALGRGPRAARPRPLIAPPTASVTDSAYRAMVAAVIGRIAAGDLFQANIARRLDIAATGPIDAFAVFEALAAGDAAHAAFVRQPEGAIVSNSPERFFRIRKEGESFSILAEPIKGTRPRGANRAEDAAFAAELLASAKDRAENIMIADLVRNDLSRICRDHTIREEAVCALAPGAQVHHLVSRISGVLRADVDAVGALAALFPCGSVTGAPKIEAMRVIADLEGVGRGPYCGAIGYIDDSGAADFSVAIRTILVEGARASFCVGGGVTLPSDPDSELEETRVKARALLAAFDIAQRMTA